MNKPFFRILVLIALSFFYSCKSSENMQYENILSSRSIKTIEEFLRNSHPQDSRRAVLKPRLIALKNAVLKQNTNVARQLVAKPTFVEFSSNAAEAEEFKNLINVKSTAEHQQKTVKLLNAMFDQDISSKEVILLIQNKSDCNMILRLEGSAFYNLAIPVKGENSIVIQKGDYALSSNVCDVKYTSSKKIPSNTLVILNSPTVERSLGSESRNFNSKK